MPNININRRIILGARLESEETIYLTNFQENPDDFPTGWSATLNPTSSVLVGTPSPESFGYAGASGGQALAFVYSGGPGTEIDQVKVDGAVSTSGMSNLFLRFGGYRELESALPIISWSSDDMSYSDLSFTTPNDATWRLIEIALPAGCNNILNLRFKITQEQPEFQGLPNFYIDDFGIYR